MQILEFPIFSLANSLHTAYSTLYLSTIDLLAKWTIAKWPSASPLGIAFLIILEKPPFALKIDGISTEPDTWKGLQILQNQLISVGWLCIGFTSSAALVRELFQAGVLELRGMSCRSGSGLPIASTPLQKF